MAVGVTNVHLTNVPRHVRGRPRDIEALLQATLIDVVNVIHPDRQPNTLVGRLIFTPPLPRPPWAPWQRKISHLPERTHPKVGGSPQSQPFVQPSFANHAKLSAMSETFRIGVRPSATMRGAAHGTLADSHVVANDIGGIVAMHDVSGLRVGSSKNCMTIAA